MRKFMLFAVAVSLVSVVGCSGSDVSEGGAVASGSSTTATGASQAVAASSGSTPAKTVQTFLEAVRTGNANVATSCLTPLALEQIDKNGMDVTPPASETSKFTVGEVDIFEADKAFVDSVWIELDADGQPFNESLTWGLRLIDGQWRISGMAAGMGPNQQLEVIDFENPDQFVETEQQAPANSQQQSVPRQADQSAEDPFNQTISR